MQLIPKVLFAILFSGVVLYALARVFFLLGGPDEPDA
jgi:hypothetical protein